MADWRDVMEARREADEAGKHARERVSHANGLAIAITAIQLEIRALATLIDYRIGGDA